MADNLTLRLKEELARRGRIVSDSDIEDFLNTEESNVSSMLDLPTSQPQQDQSMWESAQGQQEDPLAFLSEGAGSPSSGVINALGAGLWSFADTALFGVPGALVDEEDYIDFEDPLAKWLTAGGSFAGFATGAPLRTGVKGAQALTRLLTPRLVKDRVGTETAIKAMKKAGDVGKVSKNVQKEITSGYRKLATKAQTDPKLQAENWSRAVKRYGDEYIETGIKTGVIQQSEVAAVRRMFDPEVVLKRPIQDLHGLIAKFRGKDDRLTRFLGHAANDILVFSTIDAVFEGVSVIEDHEFDWTNVLWGAGQGLAFSSLSLLNPKGKSSAWFPDFKTGLRAVFAKKGTYNNKNDETLASMVRFMGKIRKNNGEDRNVPLKMTGKDGTVKQGDIDLLYGGEKFGHQLGARKTLGRFKDVFGEDDYRKAMIKFLETEKSRHGKDMLSWATRQEAQNIKDIWGRMVMGGIFFNAQTWYEMYFNEADIDFANDILPNFLIGAFIQRRQNPATFDARTVGWDDNKINSVRENLAILGFRSEQLTQMPSLRASENPLRNPLYLDEYKKVIEVAEQEGIISDDNDMMEVPIGENESSMGLEQNSRSDFDWIYTHLQGHRAYLKPLDNISTTSAKKVADAFLEINKKVNFNDPTNIEKFVDGVSLKQTEEFESQFKNTLQSLAGIDELQIERPQGNEKYRIPEQVYITESLINKARKGQLRWLVDSEGNQLDGQQALDALYDTFDGLNSILKTNEDIGNSAYNKTESNIIGIENESSAREIYQRITSAEDSINNMFPNKSSLSSKFGFANNYNDYSWVLMRNHAIKTAKGIVNIFRPDFSNRSDVVKRLKETGLINFDNRGRMSLISTIDQVKIKPTDDPEMDAENLRFLGRVLAIQKITGNYKIDKTQTTTIDNKDINSLKRKLSDYGYDESRMPQWLHRHITDFALREKIEDAPNLTLKDMDIVMNLAEMQLADVNLDSKGNKDGSFVVTLLDTNVFNNQVDKPIVTKKEVEEHNERLIGIANRSNGLININQEKAIVIDSEVMQNIVNDSLPDSANRHGEGSARDALIEFLNFLGTSNKPGSQLFRMQLGKFLEEAGPQGQQRAIKWLKNFGIVKFKKGERKYDVNMKKYNDEIAQQVGENMNMWGITSEYAESHYSNAEKTAKDREALDFGEGEYQKVITSQEFFNKYSIDKDSPVDQNNQELILNNIIFEGWDLDTPATDFNGRTIRKGRDRAIKDILDRMYVKKGDKFFKYNSLSKKEQLKRKPEIIQDLTGLISPKKNQIKIERLEFKNGKLSKKNEVKQRTKFDNFFERELGISYFTIDPYVTLYVSSEDGRTIQKKQINVFGNSKNLNIELRDEIETYRNTLDKTLLTTKTIEGSPVSSKLDDGLVAIRLTSNLSPIVIKTSDYADIKEKFDTFADKWADENSGLNKGVRDQIKTIKKELQKAEDKKELGSPYDIAAALRRMMFKDMFSGSDGDTAFIELMNGKDQNGGSIDVAKLLGRVKLYETKKFVRYDKELINDVMLAHRGIGTETSRDVQRILKNRINKNGFGVAIWNDESVSNVKDEVKEYIKKNKIDFNLDSVMGDAHSDVSGFDSIAYVSRDTLKFFHTMMGHDPNSYNPIKPVISSSGENSPLLYGKTLFIHSKDLDSFFEKNKGRGVDILLTKSGAKSYNKKIKGDKDVSLVDAEWKDLHKHRLTSNDQVRKISLDSIGAKPEKDTILSNAKKSHADMNYSNNDESRRYYEDHIESPLSTNLNHASKIIENVEASREWIKNQYGDEALVSLVDGKDSLNNLNGMAFFAGLSRDANPMSYSESILKNKIYGSYIDPLINNQRAVTNQHSKDDSIRYGGQAALIQAPILAFDKYARLAPTLVDENGKYQSRGEVLLPAQEADMKISDLAVSNGGMEFRIVEGADVYNPAVDKKALGEKYDWEKDVLDKDITLGDLQQMIFDVSKDENRPNLQVGIIVRRNPRTRPNDMTLLGLKGFLGKEYGNSIMVNSFDVVNIFEGDYDADKADYFYSQKGNMYDHVVRSSQHYVQGVDPTAWMKNVDVNFTNNSTDENDIIEGIAADTDLYKSSIGLVQKVPRMLGYLNNLAGDLGQYKRFKKWHDDGNKLLYEGKDYKIVMDYDNLDWYLRSALETQYIIDGKGRLNSELSSDIFKWRTDFLFPLMEDSFAPSVKKKNRAGFANETNQINSKGSTNEGKRIRIFKRLQDDGKEIEERDLSQLDKAIISQMLNEYSKFLGVTGNTVYENSGEQRRATYDDVMNQSDRFFKFNADLGKSLYYRLRNKFVDPITKDKDGNVTNTDKWKDNDEFKYLFGVKKDFYWKGKGKKAKKKTYFKYTDQADRLFNTTVTAHSKQFAQGQRGSPIERILHQVWKKNLFNYDGDRSVAGESVRNINTWFDSLSKDPRATEMDIDDEIGVLRGTLRDDMVISEIKEINSKMDLIASLKRKIAWTWKNSNQKYDKKIAFADKMNKLIQEAEDEINKFLTKKYKDTKKSKYLEKIKFVDVDSKNMKKGTIYYSTMEQIKNFLPGLSGERNFGLGPKGQAKLDFIKAIRKTFYSNRENLSEVLKYGTKTALNSAQLEYLAKLPEQSTHIEIENRLLLEGIKDHGIRFLYQFMQPTVNKKSVGLFNGRPIAVPFEAKEGYDPSSRYRKGINFLTQVAMGNDKFHPNIELDPQIRKDAANILKGIIAIEAHFTRFYNKKFHIKDLQSKEWSDVVAFGNRDEMKMVYDNIRLPNFHTDLESRLTDFGGINWTKSQDRMRYGLDLMNDHLFKFYRDIMDADGRGEDFDNYINQMNEINNLSMGNRTMNPILYMDMRNNLDNETKNLVEKTISHAVTGDANSKGLNNTKLSKAITSNPVYILMGGDSFFTGGLNLTKQKSAAESLNMMASNSRRIQKSIDNLPMDTDSHDRIKSMEEALKRMKEEC